MIDRPYFGAALNSLNILLEPSQFMPERSEVSSFSEKNMSKVNGNSNPKQNPFTLTGDHSTVALLGNLFGCEVEEKRTDKPCGCHLRRLYTNVSSRVSPPTM